MGPQQAQFAFPRPTPMVVRLLVVLGALWLLFAIAINLGGTRLFESIYRELWLVPTEAVPGLRLWQVGTYAWLHDLDGLSHILFNSLALYFLGPTLERRWGGRGFLKFFVLSGILAGLFSVLVGFVFGGRWDLPIVGASGAIFGLLAAFSILFPNAQMLLFFVVPVRARYIVWIAIIGDLLFFVANPRGNVAIQTHMGGALAGWLLVTGNWRPSIFWPKLKRRLGGGKKPPPRGGFKVLQGGKDRDYLH